MGAYLVYVVGFGRLLWSSLGCWIAQVGGARFEVDFGRLDGRRKMKHEN